MKEIRCKKCKSLLMVLNEGGEVKQTHIKCRKCGKINQIIEVKYNPNYETRKNIINK
jgi:phage FluMu protein Com